MTLTRNALPSQMRALRSQKIANAVCEMQAFKDARIVAAYSAVRSEASVALVAEASWAQGKTVVFPRVEERLLVFHQVGPQDALEEGAFGVPEPSATTPVVDLAAIDLVLVPALAADPNGFRIGYGGGYYDRTLPHVGGVSCVTVYDFQLISEVPALEFDVAVDAVVTDSRTIDVKS